MKKVLLMEKLIHLFGACSPLYHSFNQVCVSLPMSAACWPMITWHNMPLYNDGLDRRQPIPHWELGWAGYVSWDGWQHNSRTVTIISTERTKRKSVLLTWLKSSSQIRQDYWCKSNRT